MAENRSTFQSRASPACPSASHARHVDYFCAQWPKPASDDQEDALIVALTTSSDRIDVAVDYRLKTIELCGGASN
jgi:hypothetical protein